jgi:hypothetical protein
MILGPAKQVSKELCFRKCRLMKRSSWLQQTKLSQHVSQFKNSNKFIVIDNNPYIQFTIKDYPGNYELKDTSQADISAIKGCGSLIYVIDAQP